MAKREQLYARFGVAAEAAQLFETELGTLLLCLEGLAGDWHIKPNPERAEAVLKNIDKSTLGKLLANVRSHIHIESDLERRILSALAARNRLMHGFYERHNFRIQSANGRDIMIADLEELHSELFNAWQIAGAMTAIVTDVLAKARSNAAV